MSVNFVETIYPERQLSERYTIADLTKTSEDVENLPGYEHLENLTKLAELLERIEDLVGKFTVHSAFRSAALQDVLNPDVRTTASGKSYHELGLAADISPWFMPLDQMFAKIITDPALKSSFAEIAIKPSQGSIHVAAGGPNGKLLFAEPDGKYRALTGTEIASYTGKASENKIAIAGVVDVRVAALIFIMGLGLMFTVVRRRGRDG